MIVYFHRNPKTFDIFYVGIGNDFRPHNFYFCDRNVLWSRLVSKYGKPIVQIVHAGLNKTDACEWEVYYIKLFGIINEGGQLANLSYGGETSPMHNKLIAKKVAEKLRGRKRTDMIGSNNPMANDRCKAIARKTMIEKILPNKTEAHKEKQRESARRLFTENNPRKNPLSNYKLLEKQRKRVIQMDIEGNELIGHISINDAGRYISKSGSKIHMCCVGKRRTAYGFKWKFAIPP